MTVAEYTRKFEELCRFSRIGQGNPTEFEEWKCIKFQGGLREDLLAFVGPMEIRTFAELVKVNWWKDAQRSWKLHRRTVESYNLGQKQGEQSEQDQDDLICPKCGKNHGRRCCQFGMNTCYYCSKEGHLARDCRKRIADRASRS
ncbi:hypothetical protein PIB30_044058 [Stylosanthes scabra]|uniref:CCHC-type domain-containing protein n=1 Tax=Stylosanthes scabra TaxID=79078 RepID=A0ABU6UHT9_9FABA|nr:hypothetical protein [Stylosanthes scabra]